MDLTTTAYRYVGAAEPEPDADGAPPAPRPHLTGVPLRDLTVGEIARMPRWLVDSLVPSGLYVAAADAPVPGRPDRTPAGVRRAALTSED
jgi:hypothetical protein